MRGKKMQISLLTLTVSFIYLSLVLGLNIWPREKPEYIKLWERDVPGFSPETYHCYEYGWPLGIICVVNGPQQFQEISFANFDGGHGNYWSQETTLLLLGNLLTAAISLAALVGVFTAIRRYRVVQKFCNLCAF